MSQKQNQSLVNKNYNNANKTDRRRNDIKNAIATGYGSETTKHANKSKTDQSDLETSLETNKQTQGLIVLPLLPKRL
jgi:activator of 2-hydroxyglutaryl-CoA dehydratase